MAGIEKQLEEVKKQLAFFVASIVAASPQQEAEDKRVINSNKTRVEKEKGKEAEVKKIKEMRKQGGEGKKKQEEVLKEVKKLKTVAQSVKEAQKKAVQAYAEEVDSLTNVNRVNLLAEGLIKLGEKLKEAMGMKKKIEEERNREVKNMVGDKK